jgi:phosphoglycolate phosphatase-like HAD superfamily hydrolase/ADP-ribose pyrophosphatase YjhB (NUDIX family)
VIRNIIFDWSGTLVDDLPAVFKASNFVLAQAGKPAMSLRKFREEFQLPFTKFYDRYTPNVPTAQLEQWFHAKFRQSQHAVTEMPHAREFLEFCRENGLRTLLLSTIHPDHFKSQCRENGFDAYLDQPYTGVRDKREKIHALLKENHLRPEETLFVGDMEHDVMTARHGGIHSCAVLTGYNTLDQLRAANPELIVEHLGELKRLLRQNGFELQPPAGQPDPEMPLPTVGALVFNDRHEVLMILTHKWSNKWGIPGGKIKFGETSQAALRREILEETGLRVTHLRFVQTQDCIHSKEFYKDAHFVLLTYTVRTAAKNPRVVLNEEGRDFKWLTLAAAKKLPLNGPTKILVDAVLKQQKPCK